MEILEIAPWICWISPLIGALLTFTSKKNSVKGLVTSISIFTSFISSLFMLSNVIEHKSFEIKIKWIDLQQGEPISLGVLVDALSATMSCIVSFVSLLILLYSIWYMREEYGQARFWSLMSLFTSSMLLLVLADNFILFFIGWKMVGLCSYALIGHYYRDEEKYWIGGPPPNPLQKPSTCALKALLVTSLGDVAMLSGILLIFIYSGTFNFTTLFTTSSTWISKMIDTQNLFTLSTILLLLGVIGKSAQFPLHVWLPEAMAGPAPVSALIHAATMVKAGVYIIARLFPIYYKAYWVDQFQEAGYYFQIIATVGTVTAFLTATEALASIELKKVLACSTMSQIGYMMLGLGVAGMSHTSIVSGYIGSILHLLNHALFKAALFMCAGIVIHLTGSIYLYKSTLNRRNLFLTWLFMWIAVLSLIGLPPLSGFWSKDEILIACIESGQYVFFLFAVLTILVTCLYSLRMMYYLFHRSLASNNHHGGEEPIAWMPIGILSTLTLIIGIIGYQYVEFFKEAFSNYFALFLNSESLHHETNLYVNIITIVTSLLIISVAIVASYIYYFKYKGDYIGIIERNPVLRTMHRILWNRWYLDRFYEIVFVRSILKIRSEVQNRSENLMDSILNIGVPRLFSKMYDTLKYIQTGVFSINMFYILVFLISIFIFTLMVMGYVRI
ncbi:MAG: NADH-quinone oxidoreductase subunit L [Candidatus Caldarchaeales archaeon]